MLLYCLIHAIEMQALKYSNPLLLAIGKDLLNTSRNRIDRSTWLKLNELKIANRTKRGCRAGLRKARPIMARISNRGFQCNSRWQECALNSKGATTITFSNLTYVRKINLSSPSAKFAIWNARSMKGKSKSASIIDFVIANQLDILSITETWLTGDDRDNRLLADLNQALPDHDFHHLPRAKRGGGVGVLLRREFDVAINDPTNFRSFEYIDLTISSSSSSVRLFTVYRPPPSKTNRLTTNMFFVDFSILVELFTSLAIPVIIAGDFNFHMDVPNDTEAIQMRALLDSCSLEQYVSESTHRCNHTLDLLITRVSDNVVSNVNVDRSLPSDHAAVMCLLKISRPLATKKTICFRKLRSINMENFRNDITASLLVTNPAEDTNELCTQFHRVLSQLLDLHAPKVVKCVTLRSSALWFNDELRIVKRARRRCERQYLKSSLHVHKELYRQQCRMYTELLDAAKTNFHSSQLADCNPRQLFRAVDKLCSANTS